MASDSHISNSHSHVPFRQMAAGSTSRDIAKSGCAPQCPPGCGDAGGRDGLAAAGPGRGMRAGLTGFGRGDLRPRGVAPGSPRAG